MQHALYDVATDEMCQDVLYMFSWNSNMEYVNSTGRHVFVSLQSKEVALMHSLCIIFIDV